MTGADDTETDCFGGVSPPSPKGRAEREQQLDTNLKKANNMTTSKKILPLTLISLLILMVAATTGIQAVKASNAALLFTPNYISGDPPGEASYSDSVANMVYYYFYTYGSNYAYTYNCEDSAATVSNYMSCLSYAQNNFYNSVIYSKGHEVPFGDGNHYEILDHNAADLTDYPDVFDSTGASDRFVFLWHCGTAMSYPTWWDTWNGGGYPGMAFDFTHDNSMSHNGYGSGADTGVYVFLGFIYYSQEYLTGTSYQSYNYGDFVTIFYQYLLQYHYSVSSALDAAAILTLGSSNFGNSALHTGIVTGGVCGTYDSYMVVYGDGNLRIPS